MPVTAPIVKRRFLLAVVWEIRIVGAIFNTKSASGSRIGHEVYTRHEFISGDVAVLHCPHSKAFNHS